MFQIDLCYMLDNQAYSVSERKIWNKKIVTNCAVVHDVIIATSAPVLLSVMKFRSSKHYWVSKSAACHIDILFWIHMCGILQMMFLANGS